MESISEDKEHELKEFIVEKVLEKRKNNRKTEYLIKWQDYPDSDNTWEPSANFKNNEVVAKFEKSLKNVDGLKTTTRTKKSTTVRSKKVAINKDSRERVAQFIIGITGDMGNHSFLIKFMNQENPELITANEAHVKYPQTVIKFYEERLTWNVNQDQFT